MALLLTIMEMLGLYLAYSLLLIGLNLYPSFQGSRQRCIELVQKLGCFELHHSTLNLEDFDVYYCLVEIEKQIFQYAESVFRTIFTNIYRIILKACVKNIIAVDSSLYFS